MDEKPKPPGNPIQRVISYFSGLVRKLMELKDTPHSIAGGVAIGMFFGFTPLFGLKTLLCLGAAYALRCNAIAAVVTVCLHDIITPFWPVLLRFEYDIGYWILSNPHRFPPRLETHHFHLEEMMKWTTFLNVGLPLLVGSLFIAVPAAAVAYVVTLAIAKRRNRRLLEKENAKS
ncbi:MAG: DUF2062 domain-containing protein [Terrimicrobiaceae bacterium]